jgi:di/tricarboxylate transporter
MSEAAAAHPTLLDTFGLTLSDTSLTVLAISLFVLTYVMILLEKYVHRTVAALLGACAVMILGLLTPDQAWGSIDFNTIFLLFGMMNIVNVLSRSGFFDLVARWGMLYTRGEPARVLWIFSLLTAVFSAFLDNVTTVLFMAPVVVTVVVRLGLKIPLLEHQRLAKCWCTKLTVTLPSPTALATRLTLDARRSPTAKMPGTLVSRG